MWIQVRSMDGKKTIRLDNLSKLTAIEEVRERLVEHFDAPVERQKLFYRGKLLVDGHKLFDYDVNRNDLIQILVRQAIIETPKPEISEDQDSTEVTKEESQKSDEKPVDDCTSSQDSGFEEAVCTDGSTYKIGDIIDARDPESGAWFEAEIKKITKNTSGNESEPQSPETDTVTNEKTEPSKPENVGPSFSLPTMYQEDDGFLYHVLFEGYEDDDPSKLQVKDVRPRARKIKPADKVQVGDRLLVCYNMDEPKQRGYWFDATITEKRVTRTIKDIKATLFIGKELVAVEDCVIMYWWDMMELECPGTQLNKLTDPQAAEQSPVKRASKPDCEFCKDKPNKKCKECACRKCGGKESPEKQILCDECEGAYHIWCLTPPLENLPDDDEWFCPVCKNDAGEIVQTGERLKASKKKAKMASVTGDCKRDWGKGMACVGRTAVCTIVPPNHFGPIPGVAVGTLWKFRLQVSEAGVHRPHVAGIHGREDEGAYSIVLSGGYEDDEDDGDQFTYTGSGGRDLSGNKRTAEQSCDQTLTRMNKALAKNCAATLDNKNGAEAKDWTKGKPVRVVRNCKGRKHSSYAPEEGNRYDGIFKVVKYWPQKGQSGFIVWRYLLRRDDPNPAPWTKAGKKNIANLGLTMQYPEGYLEKQEERAKENEETPKQKGKGKKRKKIDSESESENQPASPKKAKVLAYKIAGDIKKLIKEDSVNEKVWQDAIAVTKEGGQKFLAKVEELFLCICCQDLVFQPITTPCLHNTCKSCLSRSFKAEVYSCPACRTELGKDFKMTQNKPLTLILKDLFPGYENGR